MRKVTWVLAVFCGCGGGDRGGAADFGGSTGGDASVGSEGVTSGSASMSASGGTGSATTPDTSAGQDSSGGPIFDVANGETGDVIPGACCGEADFSYIWIANSGQSTVSKINTRTLVEEGRYITRPDQAGNPSRTSVTVDGRAVAVANRNGGVVKIWARPEDCAGPNTSSGPNDIKAWDSDDCVAWYTEFPLAKSQRPVAWTSGVLDEDTCTWADQKLWTAEGRGEGGIAPVYCNDDVVWVHRLDGETGMIEDSVELPYPCTTFGIYGGAVDSNNDLWLTRLFEGSPGAIRVDFDDLSYDTAPPFYGYGITVDHNGMIWGGTGVPGKWDPATQTWTQIMGSINNAGVGLAEDHQERMWVGIVGGIQAIDTETMQLLETVMFAGLNTQCKGISVDVDGYVWAVPDSGDRAFKVDPDALTYEMVGGLIGAYTYSDMTGGALNSVACNPPAG
jgi:hypothetical protein